MLVANQIPLRLTRLGALHTLALTVPGHAVEARDAAQWILGVGLATIATRSITFHTRPSLTLLAKKLAQ